MVPKDVEQVGARAQGEVDAEGATTAPEAHEAETVVEAEQPTLALEQGASATQATRPLLVGPALLAPPAAQPALAPGSVLLARYQIERKLSAGGMGAVYAAFDRTRSETIAIKVLLPKFLSNASLRARFLEEAKITSRLSHPGIVNVYDVQQDGELFFLTMELLEGESLGAFLKGCRAKGEPVAVERVRSVGSDVCEALAYAHAYLVHRDIKPDNIWLGKDGRAKVMDFGLARPGEGSNRTVAGRFMGTFHYAPPEQERDATQATARSDVYSVGVVLYEMLAGELPRARSKPLCELRSDVPRGISDAIDKALATDPADRFADMASFRAELVREERPAPPAAARPRMGRRIAVAAAALVLTTGGLALAHALRGDPQPPASEVAPLASAAVASAPAAAVASQPAGAARAEPEASAREPEPAPDPRATAAARAAEQAISAARRALDGLRARGEELAGARDAAASALSAAADSARASAELELACLRAQVDLARTLLARLDALERDAALARGELDAGRAERAEQTAQEVGGVAAQLDAALDELERAGVRRRAALQAEREWSVARASWPEAFPRAAALFDPDLADELSAARAALAAGEERFVALELAAAGEGFERAAERYTEARRQGEQRLRQLERELEPNARGQNRLHERVAAGDTGEVTRLLALSVPVDVRDGEGASALHLAAALPSGAAAVSALLAAGADARALDSNGCTALHLAARHAGADVVGLLLASEPGVKNAQDAVGSTPLLAAARAGNAETVALLLRTSGVDALARDRVENTALHLAAGAGHAAVVELLLESFRAAGKLEAYNRLGKTARDLARERRHAEIVALLER